MAKKAYQSLEKKLIDRALKLGAKSAKLISPREVVTASWVRLKCQYGCGGYNSSLVCPPHTPTPDETRHILDEFEQGLLFESRRLDTKRIAATLERELFLQGFYMAFGLGSGPCRLCRTECCFEAGCRHPDEARPSMEACGIDVYATVRKQGYALEVVRSPEDTARYFGLVLIT